MAAFSSFALGVGALTALASTGMAVRGEQQQRQSRYRTRDAQNEALRVQMIERSRSVQAEMEAANRPSPASTISLDEMLATTDRTGGVDDRLRLSRPTKLGGA